MSDLRVGSLVTQSSVPVVMSGIGATGHDRAAGLNYRTVEEISSDAS